MHEKEENTDQAADALFAQIPDEIIHFIRNYFVVNLEDPDHEVLLRADLLTKVLIKFMLQLYRLGIDDEFQPVFVAANYVKPHTGGVTECKRTYETIGGEPYQKFNLSYLSQEYEEAYKKWIKETFGVELSEDGAEKLQQWVGVWKNG